MKHNTQLKRTQEEVVESFKKVHGNRYDYSRVAYTGTKNKVIIGCQEHGWFEQMVSNHKKGRGCIECGKIQANKSKKITLEEFISRSQAQHGNKYDYSLVDLENNRVRDKVKIICPTHGVFSQNAHPHMLGFGCRKCSDVSNGDNYKLTQSEFIEIAKATHGDLYDYSKTVYTYAKKKVTITCKKHGDFEQEACAHTCGQGCPQCRSSKGEKAIASWLESRHIDYISEKRFKDCLSPRGNTLKFDFYLTSYNALIEFDGSHHYKVIEYWGSNLKCIQEHDKIKTKYAKKKGMPLLRIPYFRIDEIPDLLSEFLFQTAAAA